MNNTSWQIVPFLCFWIQAGLSTYFVKIIQMITKLVNWSWISCSFRRKKNIKNKLFINEIIFTALALFFQYFKPKNISKHLTSVCGNANFLSDWVPYLYAWCKNAKNTIWNSFSLHVYTDTSIYWSHNLQQIFK